MVRSAEHSVAKVTGVIFSAITICFFALNCLALIAPPTTISWSARRRTTALSLVPEGWAFFTRSAREETVIPLHPDKGNFRPLIFPNAGLKSSLGFSREARIIGLELGSIVSGIPTSAWDEGRLSTRKLDYERLRPTPLIRENRAKHPRLCGSVLLERRSPPPFAWSSIRSTLDIPTSRILLEITCKHG